MTKQEEIREEIKLYGTGTCIYQDGSYPCPIGFEANNEVCLDCLMAKLHSQGLVIKVERELPGFIDKVMGNQSTDYIAGLKDGIERLQQAGFGAFDPLI